LWLQLPPPGPVIAPGPPRASWLVSWHRTTLGPLRTSWLQLPPPGPAVAPGPPRAPGPRLSSPGAEQLRDRHVPCGQWLRVIKVNKYLLTAQPSWSLSGRACVSSKALYDMDDAYKTCGQAGCRSGPAQRRPVARSRWFATVRSGSTTLGRQLR
jgi:hypothetical protein